MCMDLHLSPGDCVYVEAHNGFVWCFGRFDIDSFLVFSYKSCDSKYFIFNTAFIPLRRECAVNRYWRDPYIEYYFHFFIYRLWERKGLTFVGQVIFGINAKDEKMPPGSIGQSKTWTGTEPKCPKSQSCVLILSPFFPLKIKVSMIVISTARAFQGFKCDLIY